jgi:hypothetical protein
MAALVVVLCGSGASAKVQLMGEAALLGALEHQPPCCVIDARPAQHRNALPLPEAVAYRPGMKIVPTASVVIVADSDEQAMAIARRFDKAYPGKSIIAVQGGHAVWTSVLAAAQQSRSLQGSRSFVIPSNTCEQGRPLQTLSRKQP